MRSYYKLFLLFLSFFLFSGTLRSQPWSNLREKIIFFSSDTLSLDSLSILPGSVKLKNRNGVFADSSQYRILNAEGLIIRNSTSGKDFFSDSMIVSYRVFPYSFTETYFHKDKRKLGRSENGIINPFLITYDSEPSEIFKFGGLNKSGSISRGISFGNNQDVVVNSSLNLQLAGKLNDNVDVLAAITDENIPFQPEGNTQQIQEFDKVFIQLSNSNVKLIAGDYELKKPNSYFMNFYKKAQGGSLSTAFPLTTDANEKPLSLMRTNLSVAVSKGKFGKNSFTGVEGNQGPYRLTGANSEQFIIVLSGSEKVYINGMLMDRGLQNDYTIDYNTAQLSFTPRRVITKDSRIVVEFQYSDKNYLRSLIYFNDEIDTKKWKIRFNLFSEQDSKNQSLQQTLTDNQKKFLKSIGDSLNLAYLPNVDTIGFDPNQILYKQIDTLDILTGTVHQKIFVYSSSADSAIYRVGFSFVGQGQGNYNPANTAANGKVYEWIMPRAGILQGSYEPVSILITPKMQQLYTLAADYSISKNTMLTTETAMSNNDLNTFSTADKKDNIGFAEKFAIRNSIPVDHDSAGWRLNTGAEYEYDQKFFKPAERFRSVEFDRDWNLGSAIVPNDEHIAGVTAGMGRAKNGSFQFHSSKYLKGSSFQATANGVNTDLKASNFRLLSEASLMNSSASSLQTRFLRHRADLMKSFKYFSIGVKEGSEDNRFFNLAKDSLRSGSYQFQEWETYFQNPDTLVNKFRIFAGRRLDRVARVNDFFLATRADNTGLSFGLLKNPNHHLSLNSTYRVLHIIDTTLTTQKEENTIVTNLDHSLTLFNGGVSFNTYYEIGTGQELKKEYAYLEVPAGQGTYAWIDYNNDGIKQLNEFENALTPDQAKYIKVLVPTNEYIRTYSNQFSEIFNLAPAGMMDNPTGFKKFVARFSDQMLFRRERKTTEKGLSDLLNPFRSDVSDSTLVTLNSTIQNTFFFNRSSSKFGFDLGYQDNRSKSALTNGFESHTLGEKGGNIRWNITRVFGIVFGYHEGEKTNSSEFFASRDYRISYNKTEPKFTIQPSSSFRISLTYVYGHKMNLQDTLKETANQHNAGTELKYSTPKQGTMLVRFNYIRIQYNAAENSPIAYEMLEGLKKGENYTWGFSLQRTLASGLQLSINYDGRKPARTKPIHIGGVSLRAYF